MNILYIHLYIHLILIGSAFLISCSSASESFHVPTILFQDLQENRRSAGYFENIKLSTPLQIMVFDSLLLIHDQFEHNGESFFFSFINRFSGKEVKLFGREGRGPDEFLFPGYISRIPGRNDVIGINNRKLFSFVEVSVKKVLDDSLPAAVSQIDELHTDYSMVGRVENDRIIGTGFFDDGRYAVSNQESEMIEVGISYPFEEKFENTTRKQLGMPYQSNFRLHPEKPMLVSATVFAANLDVISFYNDKLKIEKQIHTNYPLFENESNSQMLSAKILPENLGGYRDLDVSKAFIYTLYSGVKRKEGLSKYSSGDRVLIFDWEGNAYKQLNLDKTAIKLAVSPDDQYMYTISLNEEDTYEINVYELKF